MHCQVTDNLINPGRRMNRTMYNEEEDKKGGKPNKAYIPCIAEIGKAPLVEKDVRVRSTDKCAEALIERDVDDIRKLVVVPMDDCMIEVMWSHEHERLVAVVREVPFGEDC